MNERHASGEPEQTKGRVRASARKGSSPTRKFTSSVDIASPSSMVTRCWPPSAQHLDPLAVASEFVEPRDGSLGHDVIVPGEECGRPRLLIPTTYGRLSDCSSTRAQKYPTPKIASASRGSPALRALPDRRWTPCLHRRRPGQLAEPRRILRQKSEQVAHGDAQRLRARLVLLKRPRTAPEELTRLSAGSIRGPYGSWRPRLDRARRRPRL